jgi:hypothetical protein
VEDVDVLNKMMNESNSRGKKQRIKKKIDKLNGVVPDEADLKKEKALTPKVKVKELLKKRDEKMQRKQLEAKGGIK